MVKNGVFDETTPWPPPTVEAYLSHSGLEGGLLTYPTPFTPRSPQ